MVSPVLRLRLEPEQSCQDENLGTNKQEHNLAAPVQLIRVDKVWKHGRQHERRELLAHQTEGDGLGTRRLRGRLLSNGPAEAAHCRRVKHRPCDHEGEEGRVGGVVGLASERGPGDDDGPAAE